MKTSISRICAMVTFGLAASLLPAQQGGGGSAGRVWKATGNGIFDASYWFFRYPPPQGPYASFTTVKDTITLDSDNNHFTSSGTVEDLEPDGTTVNSCFTHTATRLADLR